MLEKRIEEASLNAWPALQQILFDGWILRFAKGYTKRANSVNPLFRSSINIEEKISYCEQIYTARQQPVIFRLTPFASPAGLDQALAKHHYKCIDLTLVQYLNLTTIVIPKTSSMELRDGTLDKWLEAFCRLSSTPLKNHQTHKEMLQIIPATRLLAQLVASNKTVACGLGVMENKFFGLFQLLTDPSERNQGYGANLISSMLRWAQEHDAVHAYLQVLDSNKAAVHLYKKLGFKTVYKYWYRVQNATVES